MNGRGWRSGALVEKRYIPQWFLKITDYAERLLSGLDDVQWPDGIKNMQREWIGRSEGAEVSFAVIEAERGRGGEGETSQDAGKCPQNRRSKQGTGVAGKRRTFSPSIKVFTTRPDTLWGATFMVLAPEHPLVEQITTPEQQAAVREYRERAQRVTEIERQSTERTKTGVFTGAYAENPVTGEPIPVWIADYVLMGYGTGAIMAVPAHDQRDFEFARKYDIPIVLVYKTDEAQNGDHDRGPAHRRRDGPLYALRQRAGGNRVWVCGPAQQQGDRRHDHTLDGSQRRGQRRRQLPPARLADLAAAVLGRADPDHPLPDVRRRSRFPTTNCPSCCRMWKSISRPERASRPWRPSRSS